MEMGMFNMQVDIQFQLLNNTYPTEREFGIISPYLATENMDANTVVQEMSFK